jgi:hypothetical protein
MTALSILWHTSACMQRLGIPGAPLRSMIKTIQAMTHYIRTAFGNSTESYGRPEPTP